MTRFLRMIFVLSAICTLPALAEVQIKPVEYRDGETVLQGYFAWDDAQDGRRPGVIVEHEWWGLNDYARQRAKMLAKLGYMAFAIDMYGKGRIAEHAQDASGWMKQITANVDHWQKRALLGLSILRTHELVDPTRIAAIGYCFGGATVMQMAYSGADLRGVASFHGSLPLPDAAQAGAIRASVFVAHGAQDSFVPAERVSGFMKALDAAGVDWEMNFYGGATHSFTVPDADKRGIPNISYNAKADQRSWAQLQLFLREIFDQQ